MTKPSEPSGRDKASFGFRTVDAVEKEGLVRDVFDSVASQYDLMNDLMSGGVHRIWKSVLVDRIDPQPEQTLLDMAGGTGDVAHAFLRRADERERLNADRPTHSAEAVICDINHEMLRAGRSRDTAEGYEDRLIRVTGNGECIPLPDQSVDTYTISFGIRNVTNIPAALREARRVLKFGGRFACLEFSHPVTEGFQRLYDTYSFNVIPWLGEQVTGDRDSYQYLVESIRQFPLQDAFAQMISEAGFSKVRYENLTGGIAAIHLGWRL
ncbi:MAG: class I SAM-dependent methyltransferase [Pseudomonadota bacterium]